MPGRVTVEKVQEETVHPWGRGNATPNGIQWEGQANTNVSGTLLQCNAKPFNVIPIPYPGGIGTLSEVFAALTVNFKCDNGDAIIQWMLQGRNATGGANVAPFDVGWVQLSAIQTQTRPINAAWYENSISGYLLPQTNFNKVPFELQLAFNANTTAMTQAQIKNSSYAKYKYVID